MTGRLKIFLGYAPRVGKSVRMFDEGIRRLKRGQDVVVGAIQLKGAEHLEEMLRELEVIPPLVLNGAETPDIEAILRRNPEVCLLDELARENPPGARHPHRWQDVREIVSAGITVITAINLQYIGTDTVPADFIHTADELVIVDVPADEVKRSDITPVHLTELREQALLLAAEVVEKQLQRYMDTQGIKPSWSAQERILVCITPRSSARAMLESASRATQRFHGHLLAVYVKQGELDRAAEESLQGNLDYARKIGADVHILDGSDAIARILAFAHDERITQLYIGHSQQRSWAFWNQNPVDRLIKAAEGIDVRLFPQTHAR